MAVNANSIVDFLRSKGQDSSFNSRKSIYDTSGLQGAFGDYRGTAEQNLTLLKRMSSTPAAPSSTTLAPANPSLVGEDGRTPKDVIDETTPSTIQNVYDMAKSDEEKAADAANVETSMDLAGTTARASEGLQRDVNTLNRTAAEGLFDLATAGTKKKAQIGESAAGFGGANSGSTRASQGEVAKDVAEKQGRIQSKLGDSLYNTFSDFEKNYGTEFLSKLSIPEAESFSKLPVAVRGIVMQNYQDAITKAQTTASKNALSTLEKLGYTVVGGRVIQTLAGQSAERSDVASERADRRLELAEEAATRAEKKANETNDFKVGNLKFTRNEFQTGAANAGVSTEEFSKFSEPAVNIFVNANQQVKDKMSEIDKALENKTRKAEQIRTDIEALEAPNEVKTRLKKHLDSKISTAPKEPSRLKKAIDFFFD